MTDIELLLNETVSHLESGPVTLAYLQEGGLVAELQTMLREPEEWLEEYLAIVKTRNVQWQTSKEIDETGGDIVRIWTEDLADTSLADDCDFVVWADPDATLGEDFVRFLSRN
jgi:hypothetical protein